MKLLKEHKDLINKLDEEEFLYFISDLKEALFLEVQSVGDMMYYFSDSYPVDFKEVNFNDIEDVYLDECAYRLEIIKRFEESKDVDAFEKNIEYIQSSFFQYFYMENEEIDKEQKRNLDEVFNLNLTKDIIVYNNTQKRYKDI